MSRTIRYVECTHCGKTVAAYYVTCPYTTQRYINEQPENDTEYYKRTLEPTRTTQTHCPATIADNASNTSTKTN